MLDKRNVEVYYEGTSTLFIHGQREEYVAKASVDGIPTRLTMDLSDIIFVNNDGNAIKNGMLYFDKDVEEEIYKELRINNYKDIMHDSDYEKIILHPTVDGLNKILSIRDTSQIERIRGIMYRLKEKDSFGISSKVETLIDRRHKELQSGKLKSDLLAVDKDVKVKASKEEINEVKQQNEILQNQLAEMQKMMAQLMQNQLPQNNVVETTVETTVEEDNVIDTPKTATKKKAGRPSTNKTTK